MQGMDASTGKLLSPVQHLKQSIRDVLTTRIGTRVMRRQYGSRLPELVDNPMNEIFKVELFAETVKALRQWEPRVRIDRVSLDEVSDQGRAVITLEGVNLINGEPITVEGIVL